MFHAFALSICGALVALVVASAFEWRHRHMAHGTTAPPAPGCPFSIRSPLLGGCDDPDFAG